MMQIKGRPVAVDWVVPKDQYEQSVQREQTEHDSVDTVTPKTKGATDDNHTELDENDAESHDSDAKSHDSYAESCDEEDNDAMSHSSGFEVYGDGDDDDDDAVSQDHDTKSHDSDAGSHDSDELVGDGKEQGHVEKADTSEGKTVFIRYEHSLL